MVKDISELPRRINEAFKIATSGRPGPVLVDLPKDLDPSVLRKLSHTEIQGRPIDIRPDSGRPGRPFKKRNFDKQPGDGRNFRNDRRGGKKFGGRGDRSRDHY